MPTKPYKFGARSLSNLGSVHEKLIFIMHRVLRYMDISIIEGHRSAERQEELFEDDKTKVHWPYSRHNSFPSKAVDVMPYPDSFAPLHELNYLMKTRLTEEERGVVTRGVKAAQRFALMAGLAIAIGKEHNTSIRWGGDWDKDGELTDQTFDDLPHLEIV